MPLDVHCYWNQLSLPLPNTCSPHHRHNVGCLFVVAVFGNNSCCLGGLCLLLSNVATCSGFQIQQIFARALLLLFERSIIPAACCPILQPARRPFLALPLITVALSLLFPLYLDLYLSVFVLFVFVFVVSVSVFAFVCSTTFPRSLHNGRTSLHHPFVLFAFFLLAKLKGGVSLKVFIF